MRTSRVADTSESRARRTLCHCTQNGPTMNLSALVNRKFPALVFDYDARDTILYALGVGAGADPLDPRQLPYVYEPQLRIIPSQASVIAYPGAWLTEPALGVDYVKVLHGEQGVIFERPLKPTGRVRGEYKVLGVDDKGPGKGAVVLFEKRIIDDAENQLICRVQSTYFLRGDGGCGSWGQALPTSAALPDRAPDKIIDAPTIARQALIYRLSGDLNPVHADPAVAAAAGFDRPILHGLCSYGVACLSLVQELCDNDPSRLTALFTRFSRPVFPGETIRLELFEEDDGWRFRARAAERGEIVLDRGLARFS
ncbi:N-terminal half of MaoC dehydratase [Rhizobiales bacterium GAS191]|nr:N-terminal half of MaoC dehydratase [Rhizobiales bacterium GAS191]